MSSSKFEIIQHNLDNIAQWISEGLWEYQIFTRLGISKPTWTKYKKEDPNFRKFLLECQSNRNVELIPKLENALLKVALGYVDNEAVVEETSEINADGDLVVKKKIVKKSYPPDVGAIHICLKNFNRAPGTKWTDNPVGDELKRKRLEMEQQLLEAKTNGWG